MPPTWTKDGLNKISGILNLSAPISIVLHFGKGWESEREREAIDSNRESSSVP